MAATVVICESNGSGETVTQDITHSNMGATDAANLNPVTYPVTPGENTFEKWQRIRVTAMGGSSSIQNIKIWRTGALGGSAVHKTNARTSDYDGAQTYAQPSASDRSATYDYTQTMPTSEPATANLGIGGSLTGALTAAGYSDYLVHQIQTDDEDVAGSSSTLSYQYDEIA